jgi:hypothetical protein
VGEEVGALLTMIHFWKEEDYGELEKAKTFSDLVPIALRVIRRMPAPVAMISGPISTGGRGSIEANLHLLSAAVDFAHTKDVSVFDQNPFEDKLQVLKEMTPHEGYCETLLVDFYLPIFESGLISAMYFLPDWQTSTGATWEREQCKRLSIEIKEYPEEWLKELEH